MLSAVLWLSLSPLLWAAGTEAGRTVTNRAEIRYRVDGGSTELNDASVVTTPVDELLDVTVTLADSTPVPVTSPATDAVLEFLVTNIGNGTEAFRLLTRDALAGDDFDPTITTVYLESNGLGGLQVGPGGDTEYVPGASDPILSADQSLGVYLVSDVPLGLSQNQLGTAQLRAIARTIIDTTAMDDPTAAGFPSVGTAFPGLGDAADNGGNVTAVVGTAHDPSNLLVQALGSYQVNSAVVILSKSVLSVADPAGGSEVVTGSRVTYQIAVSVAGAGSVDNLSVSDPLPPELEYVPGTLSVSLLPAGEENDDDFLPSGTDNTGYDAANRQLAATLGSITGGAAAISIEFQTIVQ
ncbi:MAG: hypothetical protein ACR2PZ_24800 [Pseudomonadales bacterium]